MNAIPVSIVNALHHTTMTATGTSVGSAVAAGAAAALWSRNPSWKVADVVDALTQLALLLPTDDARAVGRGRIRIA